MTEPADARRTAEFVDSVTEATRSQLTLFWYPMTAFGLVSLGAAVVAVLVSPSVLVVYWAVAGIPASIATAIHYSRRESEMGLERSAVPYLFAAALLTLGVFGLPFLIENEPGWAIALWLGGGYGLFAYLERSPIVAAVAASFVAVGLALRMVDTVNESALVSLVSGLVLLGAASRLRPSEMVA